MLFPPPYRHHPWKTITSLKITISCPVFQKFKEFLNHQRNVSFFLLLQLCLKITKGVSSEKLRSVNLRQEYFIFLSFKAIATLKGIIQLLRLLKNSDECPLYSEFIISECES